MTSLRSLLAFVILACTAFAALADPDDGEREGGILGTGIVGTITALGSIHVNGQHIRFDPGMPVRDGVSAALASDLRPGHTVAVIAHPDGDGWRAGIIRQIVPLVGPLRTGPDGQPRIMGTRIRADGADLAGIAEGDRVAVSGLWQAGQVLATRIDRLATGGPARIEGTVFDVLPGQPLRLGGTEVTGLLPVHIRDGDVVRATGTASAGTLQASTLETGLFAGTPEIVLAEGYFSAPRPSGLYSLLGSGIVSFTDNPEMIDPAARQLVCNRAEGMAAIGFGPENVPDATPFLTDCLRPASGL